MPSAVAKPVVGGPTLQSPYKSAQSDGFSISLVIKPLNTDSLHCSLCPGHYLFVEASSPSQPGDEASLLSRTFPQTPARCLSFWYHMYGPGIGALAVYKEEGSGNVKRTELWKKSGPQDDQWIHQEITLHSAADYKVRANKRNIHFRNYLCFIFLPWHQHLMES